MTLILQFLISDLSVSMSLRFFGKTHQCNLLQKFLKVRSVSNFSYAETSRWSFSNIGPRFSCSFTTPTKEAPSSITTKYCIVTSCKIHGTDVWLCNVLLCNTSVSTNWNQMFFLKIPRSPSHGRIWISKLPLYIVYLWRKPGINHGIFSVISNRIYLGRISPRLESLFTDDITVVIVLFHRCQKLANMLGACSPHIRARGVRWADMECKLRLRNRFVFVQKPGEKLPFSSRLLRHY